MTVGEVAGLIAAVAFVLLVGVVAVPLLKLGRLFASLEREVVRGQVVPLLGETTQTVSHVNAELVRADAITANVQAMTTNASALTALFAATLGGPVVKVAAFTYGVRRAAAKHNRAELTKTVRAVQKEMRKKESGR
ncbi:MAG: DUF948 domain-containing protein [Mycobacteriales bacterium]